LTAQLVARRGADAVAAIDPSASFVAATRARLPGVDVRSGVAERLPSPDDGFDVALAQEDGHVRDASCGRGRPRSRAASTS
jgi:SAM-dependent methyltransferase